MGQRALLIVTESRSAATSTFTRCDAILSFEHRNDPSGLIIGDLADGLPDQVDGLTEIPGQDSRGRLLELALRTRS